MDYILFIDGMTAGQVLMAGKLMAQQIAIANLAKGSYRLIITKENGEIITGNFEKL